MSLDQALGAGAGDLWLHWLRLRTTAARLLAPWQLDTGLFRLGLLELRYGFSFTPRSGLGERLGLGLKQGLGLASALSRYALAPPEEQALLWVGDVLLRGKGEGCRSVALLLLRLTLLLASLTISTCTLSYGLLLAWLAVSAAGSTPPLQLVPHMSMSQPA